MINIGGNIGEVYVDSTKIAEAYVGSQLVYASEILTADSYIQEGLIFQLDGIEKGADDGSWVDLIGGKVFTGSATNLSKGFAVDTNKYLSNGTHLPANENYTVEAIFMQTSGYANGRVIFCSSVGSTANYICLVRNGKNLLFLERKNTYTVTSANNVPIYISANLTRALYNGNVLSPNSSTDYRSGNSTTCVGRPQAAARYQFLGNIYAIRVYDRRLTEEEQRFNYNIDKKRYKL